MTVPPPAWIVGMFERHAEFDADAVVPSELEDEPSIRPVFRDLTAQYLSDGPAVELSSIDFYTDESSVPEDGKYRGVVVEMVGGAGITLDPFWVMGIRIGSFPGAAFDSRPGVSREKVRPVRR